LLAEKERGEAFRLAMALLALLAGCFHSALGGHAVVAVFF